MQQPFRSSNRQTLRGRRRAHHQRKDQQNPTICAHSATATATMARNITELRRSDTPFASANSGWRLAKSSGREMTPSDPRWRCRATKVSTRCRLDGDNIAEQQCRRLARVGREEVQEQQAEPQRQGHTMPTATSRWASCSPSSPIPIPAATVIVVRPRAARCRSKPRR